MPSTRTSRCSSCRPSGHLQRAITALEAGTGGSVSFEVKQPAGWSFAIEATVQRPDATPGASVHVDVWREDIGATIVYDAVAGASGPARGIRFGTAAAGLIETAAGSHLAELLKGGVGCTDDGTACRILGDDDNFVVVDDWRITKAATCDRHRSRGDA
jgi:hypothetical protein